MSKPPYTLRRPPVSHASEASIEAIKAIKSVPRKLDECQHQLETYNPLSANGFDKITRYMANTMMIDSRELSKVLSISPREIESWSLAEGHPPNSLIRKQVVTYALRRLKHG